MNRIIVWACLVGLAALACGPATPEPVTGGERATEAPEGSGGSALERPAEPIGEGGEPTPPVEPAQGGGGGADEDFDGIADPGDQCPAEPEDRDGFRDEDGCPDPDNDGDGVSDVDDMCPQDPEDMDGQQDLDAAISRCAPDPTFFSSEESSG
ncbi:MAG: hypothetical protein GYA57_05340 [Myxococcales bacterium]|nr:hypothetical protein [Myxococcales bacterium]